MLRLVIALAMWVAFVPAAAQQPNIVLVIVDDLDNALFERMYAEGYLPAIRTHIGDRGTRFSNSFVTTSLCCPARATVLSGQYSHNHNVLDNLKPLGGVTRFNAASALPTWLKSGNYITGLVGKYLNGYGENSFAPTSSPESPRHIPTGWDFWRGLTSYPLTNYNVTHWDAVSRTVRLDNYTEYQTDQLGAFAANFIAALENYDPRPFFLYVAPFAPHQDGPGTPCVKDHWGETVTPAPAYRDTMQHYATTMPQLPSYNEADVSDKPVFIRNLPLMTTAEVNCARLQYQRRAEAMRSVDNMVQTIVDALSVNGEYANTVLIFTSDNGYALGEHRLCCKILAYEEQLRVPLLMAGPDIPVGVIGKPVLNNDLAPTIAAWARVTPALAADGRSLLPLLADEGAPWRKRFLVEYLGEAFAPPKFHAVRTGADDAVPDAYYAEWQDSEASIEFYDLATDPHQLTSNPSAPQVSTMHDYLDTLKNCGKFRQPTCRSAED